MKLIISGLRVSRSCVASVFSLVSYLLFRSNSTTFPSACLLATVAFYLVLRTPWVLPRVGYWVWGEICGVMFRLQFLVFRCGCSWGCARFGVFALPFCWLIYTSWSHFGFTATGQEKARKSSGCFRSTTCGFKMLASLNLTNIVGNCIYCCLKICVWFSSHWKVVSSLNLHSLIFS